jgi:hypothetical protein
MLPLLFDYAFFFLLYAIPITATIAYLRLPRPSPPTGPSEE